MNNYKHLALFVGGVLFGSAGLKLLASKDAKKAYTHVTAAALRAKDSVMETVTSVQENASDILASAKDINEQRAAQETVVEDTSAEVIETAEADESAPVEA
jgi:hypothetical protein